MNIIITKQAECSNCLWRLITDRICREMDTTVEYRNGDIHRILTVVGKRRMFLFMRALEGMSFRVLPAIEEKDDPTTVRIEFLGLHRLSGGEGGPVFNGEFIEKQNKPQDIWPDGWVNRFGQRRVSKEWLN